MINHIKNNAYYIFFEIVFIFISPVAILYFGLVPVTYRLWILALYAVFALIIVIKKHWSLSEFGFGFENFRKEILPYIIFTLAGVVVLYSYILFLHRERIGWTEATPLFILFLPISFLQEFLYRAFLIRELKRLFTSILSVVLVNVFLFTLLHVIYSDLYLVLPLAFVSGIGFAVMYYKYPNIWLISLSHAILNILAVLYSLFIFR